MIVSRLQIKFFLDTSKPVDLSEVTGVFQHWIQEQALGGLLIDVADYRHLPEGPGIVLIGHEGDFALETREGRLGLLYTRKHAEDADLPSQLRNALRAALAACTLLEGENAFWPALKFKADEIEIRFADRLRLPNKPESFDLVKDDLQVVLKDLYGTDAVEIASSETDPRQLLTIRVQSVGAKGIASLREHVQAGA